MELNTLRAISPLDGRYYKQVNMLSDYFSEYAYIPQGFLVEIDILLHYAKSPCPNYRPLNLKLISLYVLYIKTFRKKTLCISKK